MTDIVDIVVVTLVVLARFVVPLLIPRFPLPAIIAALLLDAVDQTIFQQFTSSDLDGYQSYDKALDIYYLAIAYISTLRGWVNLTAFSTARFLWYYRLIGVTAFELLGWRPLLLIFPNTFEYFFIWYEAARVRWHPKRLTRTHILGAAAAIWVLIKLPQEYWIHVAKLDTTDLIKEQILGVSLDTRWSDALSSNLWVIPVLVIVAAAIWFTVSYIERRLPSADWPVTFDVNQHLAASVFAQESRSLERQPRTWLIEKTILVGLISVIFSQTLPDLDATAIQIVIAVGVIIVANSFVSHWLAQRGTHWRSTLIEFAGMSAVNLAIALVYGWLLPISIDDVGFLNLVFLTMLLTLIVTYYDHFRPIHDRHIAEAIDNGNAPVPVHDPPRER